AQATDRLNDDGTFMDDEALCREAGGEPALVVVNDIDYMDVSARQMVSVGTAMIPFLEHDDASRALMGANRQRQAAPPIRAAAPLVGTGMEERAAADAGEVLQSDVAGVVIEASADLVRIATDDGDTRSYRIMKFERSNQGNSYNQKVVVDEGDRVEVGTILAD